MSQEVLIERARMNLADALASSAIRCGGVVESFDDLVLTAGVHPKGIFLNSALPLMPQSANPASVLERAQAFFEPRSFRYELWVPESDEALTNVALAAGMELAIELPMMVATDPPAVPSGIDVRLATDAAGVRDFVAVLEEAFVEDDVPEVPEMVRATFADAKAVLQPQIAIAIAYEEGEPLSCAWSFTKNETCKVGWVGTKPKAERRGLGGAVAAKVTAEGFARGATLATLEATDAGKIVYERLGFRAVSRFRTYWFL